jgi:hypothetical protein
MLSSWVDLGADALVVEGGIGPDLAAALRAEARRRVAAGEYFGHIAYISIVARRLALNAGGTALACLVLLAGGLLASPGASAQPAAQRYPDVVAVKATPRGPEVFDFDVTVSSPYDTPARYADAFRVMSKDGRVFGERVLLHAHASEQPFTRDLHGVAIPRGVRVVVVQARDQKYGYGGKTVEVALPGR